MSGQRGTRRFPAVSRADLIAVGALTLLVLAFFWRAVLGLGVFVHGDIVALFQPHKQFLHESLLAGRLPLWSPLHFCGYPIAAASQIGAFYPPGLLISRLLPSPADITWLIISHILLAALGMYALARQLGHSPFAAWLSGLVFGFSGYLFAHLHHINLVSAAPWLPLLILAAERAVRGPVLPAAALAAGAWAMIAVASHPPTLFYASLAVVFWLAWRAVEQRRSDPQAVARATVSFAVIFALGPMLAAVQLLPLIELSRGSVHTLGETGLRFVTSFSLLPKHLLGLVAPNWQGTPAFGTYRGEDYYWEYVIYLGLVPLGLAAVGAANRRGRLPLWLALCALVLALAHGNPLYRLLQYLPGFSFFRAPARFIYLFAFGGALLAGIGWDRLARLSVLAAGRRRAVVMTIAAGLVAADLMAFDRTLAPLASPTLYSQPGPVAEALQADASWHRILVRDPKGAHAGWLPPGGWYRNPDGYRAYRQRLVANVPAALGIPMLDGFTAFATPRMLEFMEAAFDLARRESNPALLSLLGVCYSVGGGNLAFLDQPSRPVGDLLVYENDEAFPRAFVVGTGLPARDFEEALSGAVLLARTGRLRRAAMIEGAADLPRSAEAPRAQLRIEAPRPERVRVSVESDGGGVLILNQRAAPGWRVRLDGEHAPALVANGILLATPLPSGPHTVEFFYRPPAFLVGRALTGLAAVVCVVLVVGPVWVRRTRRGSVTP